MTNNLTTHLDEALAKQQDNEPLYAILSQYSEESPALRPLLETAAALETLNPVVLPDDATLAADRDIFLTHVANLPPEAVSLGALGRLKGWIAERLPSKSAKLQQKELRPMTPLLIKAALVLSMIFGVTGGAAAFSSASLPDSPLYPLKLTVEEARLALAGDSAARAALHLAFAHERAEEIAQMVQAGKISNEPVQEQLQYHWQNALRLMAQAPEPAMLDLLLQADKLIQQQERTIERIQANAAIAVADPLQSQRALMAQVRLVISLALQDPQTFRQQNGNLFGKAFGENSPGGPNGPGDGVTTGPGSNGFRPGPAGPYGPGDGSCKKIGGCDGYGPGEPQAPGSGEPNGPGPGDPNGPGDGEPNGPGNGDGYGPGPGEPNGPDNNDPHGPGPGDGEPNGPGYGDGYGPGPGVPNDPGNDEPHGPGPAGPNDPGDGEPNGPGNGDGYGPGPNEPNDPSNDDPQGPGPGDGEGDGDGNGPGEPNGPGNEDSPGPGDGDGDSDGNGNEDSPGPGDGDEDSDGNGPGEPNDPGNEDSPGPGPIGPGEGNCEQFAECDSDNNQNGDDNGQNGDDSGQNGGDNDQNGGDNGQSGGDNGGNGGGSGGSGNG